MRILSYVKSLLPRLNKDQVLEDLRNTGKELSDVALPTYKNASDFFRSNRFKSDAAKNLDEAFYSRFDKRGGSKQSNLVTEIYLKIQNLKDNTVYVEEQIEKLFEREVYADGLTAHKALYLRAAEHLSFLSRLSLDILNYVYTYEARDAGADTDEGMELSPAEAKHVERNISTFAQLLGDYGCENKDFIKFFSDIPEILVNERSAAAVAGVFKETDVDPFKGAYVNGFIGNPIYHLRLLGVQWQAARYKANTDKKKMLELRLLHLELLQKNKNDPKIEQEIEYTRGRVNKIDRYLREVEEQVEA